MTSALPAPDGLIFDLDGTLWDTNAVCALAWNQAAKKLGYEVRAVGEEDLRRVCGLAHRECIRRSFESLDEAQVDALSTLTEAEDNAAIAEHGGRLYPNVVSLMTELAQRLPLFIVSNCQAGYIEIFLAQSGLAGSVRDFECWGRTKASKSENLRSVIKRNGLTAPWYVGDTDGDRTAARDNAVKFVYASYGFGALHEWDARIDAFAELAGLLAASA